MVGMSHFDISRQAENLCNFLSTFTCWHFLFFLLFLSFHFKYSNYSRKLYFIIYLILIESNEHCFSRENCSIETGCPKQGNSHQDEEIRYNQEKVARGQVYLFVVSDASESWTLDSLCGGEKGRSEGEIQR